MTLFRVDNYEKRHCSQIQQTLHFFWVKSSMVNGTRKALNKSLPHYKSFAQSQNFFCGCQGKNEEISCTHYHGVVEFEFEIMYIVTIFQMQK